MGIIDSMAKIYANCIICEKEFSFYESSAHRGLFCSRLCRGQHNKNIGLKPPTYHGDKHPSWKGGRHIWTGSRVPYVRLSIDGKRVFEHRHIMEKYLGRKLHKNEIVHHINGDSLDNRLSNLKVMGRGEHTIHHHKGVKYKK